jgi:hypothetical protein
VDPRMLIPEILHAFLEADREFHSWSRSGCNAQPCGGTGPLSANGIMKAQP